jgi:hypothetical protein
VDKTTPPSWQVATCQAAGCRAGAVNRPGRQLLALSGKYLCGTAMYLEPGAWACLLQGSSLVHRDFCPILRLIKSESPLIYATTFS